MGDKATTIVNGQLLCPSQGADEWQTSDEVRKELEDKKVPEKDIA